MRAQTRHWPHAAVHFEDFGSSTSNTPIGGAPGEKEFTVELAKSGATVLVPPGVTILNALREQGMSLPSSCESGTCGACRTGLLAGEAEHRDFVLDDDEMESEIMICVSRAKGDGLVLDL